MPVLRGHGANEAVSVSIGGQPGVDATTNVKIESDTVLVVAVTRSSSQVAVVAVLVSVAVVVVLLFFHGTESTVDTNVQASGTSSSGHSQECTSGTLFNTLALKHDNFDSTNVLAVAVSSVASNSTQVTAARGSTARGRRRRRTTTRTKQTAPSVSADNTISIQTTTSLEVADSAVSTSSELTIDRDTSSKLGAKEILACTNCISSSSTTKNGTKSGDSVRTNNTVSSKTSAALESDDSVMSSRTELTICGDIMTMVTQQILNANYISASASAADVLSQSGANKGKKD
jgi:hypothetical protein